MDIRYHSPGILNSWYQLLSHAHADIVRFVTVNNQCCLLPRKLEHCGKSPPAILCFCGRMNRRLFLPAAELNNRSCYQCLLFHPTAAGQRYLTSLSISRSLTSLFSLTSRTFTCERHALCINHHRNVTIQTVPGEHFGPVEGQLCSRDLSLFSFLLSYVTLICQSC